MTSEVFYLSARSRSEFESLSKIKAQVLLGELGFEERVKQGDKVCIKTHFGALANTRYLRPSYARLLVDYVKQHGGEPFVAESCGAGMPHGEGEYAGRASEEEYLLCAKMHGFTDDTMGCPVTMIDGPLGLDWFNQALPEGKRFKEVMVAGKLKMTDVLIMHTHLKGHGSAGFGGAIKNLGIGCVPKGGKSAAHHSQRMDIKKQPCPPDCKKCIDNCPMDALIKDESGYIIRNGEKCKRCRFCHSSCPKGTFVTDSHISQEQFIEQMCDNAMGVVKAMGKENIFYLNMVIDVVPQCDCSGASDVPIVPDIGILASMDPVALDQACCDLVHKSLAEPYSVAWELGLGENTEKLAYIYGKKGSPPNNSWKMQLESAEAIGLGSRDYELEELD
ncbi:MAG: DUF362 domain-containing protein [Candidatus Hodarchaeota archaeon]